jgi:3-keto-disaccharide hydrolase
MALESTMLHVISHYLALGFFVAGMAPPPCQAGDISEAERAEGFVDLFNGKDLSGWKIRASKDENWIVDGGLLVCTGKGSGWLGTEKEYASFELRLQYRLPAAGNSGVYLRAPAEGWISRLGMEIQLLDDEHPKYAKLDYYQYTGALYHVVAPQQRACKPAGQWNDMAIRLDGRQLVVRLNGKQLQNSDLDACLKDPVVAKEHPGLTRQKGFIGLQNHHDRVEFRNVRVKELP